MRHLIAAIIILSISASAWPYAPILWPMIAA